MELIIFSCLVAWCMFIAHFEDKCTKVMIPEGQFVGDFDNEKIEILHAVSGAVRTHKGEIKTDLRKLDLSMLRSVEKELITIQLSKAYKISEGAPMRMERPHVRILVRLYELGYVASSGSNVVLTKWGRHALSVTRKVTLPSEARRGRIVPTEKENRLAI